jgi:hypothetical protein
MYHTNVLVKELGRNFWSRRNVASCDTACHINLFNTPEIRHPGIDPHLGQAVL